MSTYVALGLFGTVLLFVLYYGYRGRRQPHLRRMAFRNLGKQKGTSLLTVIGAMVATALITATLLLQASMNASQEQVFVEQFGRINSDLPAVGQTELVKQSRSYFAKEDVETLRSLPEETYQGHPLYDEVGGFLPTVGYEALLMKTDGAGEAVALSPHTHVHGFDWQEAQTFDARALVGAPTDLADDELVLSTRTAERLDVQAGDEVTVFDAVQHKQVFTVRAVVPEQGLTGYRGIEQAQATAVVSLKVARRLAGVPNDAYTNVLVSAKESLFAPVAQSFRMSSSSKYHALLMGSGWQEEPVKAEAWQRVEHSLKFIPLFNIAGVNAILIALVLIINLFKMIAEERRQEFGILRAVGMTRRHLIRLLRMEGLLYALASGVVGALAGIGVSYLLLLGLRDTMQRAVAYSEQLDVRFAFSVDPAMLLIGFGTGALLVLLCVWFVSRRATREQIVDALRAADGAGDGMAQAKRPSLKRQAFVMVWAVLTAALFTWTLTDAFRDGLVQSDIYLLVVFGVGLLQALMMIVLVVTALPFLTAGVQALFRGLHGWTMILRMALRYPEVNRKRTGLLITMFALVFFLTSFIGVFLQSFSNYFVASYDTRAITGGYDLMATVPMKTWTTEEARQFLQKRDDAPTEALARTVSLWQGTAQSLRMIDPIGKPIYEAVVFNGIDSAFAETTTIELEERNSHYKSDREAWEAVAQDPELMIVTDMPWQNGGEQYRVGQNYAIRLSPDVTVRKKVIGVAKYDPQSYAYTTSYGYWVNQQALQGIVTDPRAIDSVLMMRLQDEGDLPTVAKRLEKSLNLAGLFQLTNPQAEFVAGMSFTTLFFSLFEKFNLLATLIGIVGLMVVMLRVIRERRQGIGMLRAIGVQTSAIYKSILIEGAWVGALGIALGLLLGSYTGSLLVGVMRTGMATDGSGAESAMQVVFPSGKLGLYFALAMAVTLLCAAIPARQAVKLSPAEATKYVG
ncbi:MAG TPA: FtsX-like permease family protein [Bacilli bacterium]|nr:FtsX-like permease family protein [Bacilli bacterium]